MELDKAILERRSCRSYDKEKEVTEEQLKEILECGIWSPSGTNSQPWRFDVLMGDVKRARRGVQEEVRERWNGSHRGSRGRIPIDQDGR